MKPRASTLRALAGAAGLPLGLLLFRGTGAPEREPEPGPVPWFTPSPARHHGRPGSDRRPVARGQTAPPAPAAPNASGQVQYAGGDVIAHVQVVNVLWGSAVAADVVSGSDAFYKALVASDYMDALGEYDTAGATVSGGGAGSNQRIYRGTKVTTVAIVPAKATGTVKVADVAAELSAQITAGVLPPVAMDADGTANTLYMISFPAAVTYQDTDGSTSCSGSNSWCATHTAAMIGGVLTPFAVVPDFASGGCATGCGAKGASPASFDAFTFNAAHEFVESITNPTWTSKEAWDGNNGEIADLCDNETAIATVGSYQLEEYWSNRLGKCIPGDPNLPLCSGAARPCRPCSPQDCTAPGVTCDVDPASATLGQCVAGSSGTSSSGGTGSASSGGGTSGGSGGSGGSSGGSGGAIGGSSGAGSGGTSGGGGHGGSDAGGGQSNDAAAAGASSSGCACHAGPGSDGASGGRPGRAGAGVALGLLLGFGAWRRRRSSR